MLKPDSVYIANGVRVNVKIIPDGTVWRDASKARAAGFSKGDLYKKQQKINKKSGHPLSVTVHNTSGHASVDDEGELYTRATFNENMSSARVHFYVDACGAWQNLKAGTGMAESDPEGSCEVSWHAGDGAAPDGGNYTSISVEVVMGKKDVLADERAYDNAARLAAWLLDRHGLNASDVVTHTYWVNKKAGKTFANRDEQCANRIAGKKWCPAYIFASTNKTKALTNWKAFKARVASYTAGGKDEAAKEKETPLSVGDKVRVKKGTCFYSNGKAIPSWVKSAELFVRRVEKDGRILLLSVEKTKNVYTGRFFSSDVEKI